MVLAEVQAEMVAEDLLLVHQQQLNQINQVIQETTVLEIEVGQHLLQVHKTVAAAVVPAV